MKPPDLKQGPLLTKHSCLWILRMLWKARLSFLSCLPCGRQRGGIIIPQREGVFLAFTSTTSFPPPPSQFLPLGVLEHSPDSAPFFLPPKSLGLGVAHLECGSPDDFGVFGRGCVNRDRGLALSRTSPWTHRYLLCELERAMVEPFRVGALW